MSSSQSGAATCQTAATAVVHAILNETDGGTKPGRGADGTAGVHAGGSTCRRGRSGEWYLRHRHGIRRRDRLPSSRAKGNAWECLSRADRYGARRGLMLLASGVVLGSGKQNAGTGSGRAVAPA